MKGIQRTVSFKINDEEYSIAIPSNRILIAIETSKAQLSNNNYSAMMSTPTILTSASLDLIDAYCWLTHACPQFNKNLKIGSILDLNVLDSTEILSAYRSKISPWISSWQKALTRTVDENLNEDV